MGCRCGGRGGNSTVHQRQDLVKVALTGLDLAVLLLQFLETVGSYFQNGNSSNQRGGAAREAESLPRAGCRGCPCSRTPSGSSSAVVVPAKETYRPYSCHFTTRFLAAETSALEGFKSDLLYPSSFLVTSEKNSPRSWLSSPSRHGLNSRRIGQVHSSVRNSSTIMFLMEDFPDLHGP